MGRAGDRQSLEIRVAGQASEVFPIACQRGSDLRSPAAAQAIRQNGSVHRACAGTAYADDLEVRLEQETIEHAPGEGTMRTAALESNGDMHVPGRHVATGLTHHTDPGLFAKVAL